MQPKKLRAGVAAMVAIATATVGLTFAFPASATPLAGGQGGTAVAVVEQLESPLAEACRAAKDALLEEHGVAEGDDLVMFCGIGRIQVELSDGTTLEADLPATGEGTDGSASRAAESSAVNEAALSVLASAAEGEYVQGPNSAFFCPYYPDREITSIRSGSVQACAFWQASVGNQTYVRYVLFSWGHNFTQLEYMSNDLGIISTHSSMVWGATLQNQKQNWTFPATDVGQNHYEYGVGYSNGTYQTGGLGTQGTGSYAGRLDVTLIRDNSLPTIPAQDLGSVAFTLRFHCESLSSGLMFPCEYPNGQEAPV